MAALSNLQKRVLAAFVYFPLLLCSVYDAIVFAWVISFIAAICWHEYLGFGRVAFSSLSRYGRILLGISPTLCLAFNQRVEFALGLFLLMVQIDVVKALVERKNLSFILIQWKHDFFSFFYLTLPFTLLVLLQREPSGHVAVWFLFFIVGVTDAAAYFAGRRWGKRPFFQHISPSKTVEGVWGGILGALLVSVVFYCVFHYYHFITPALLICVILGGIIAVSSIFGDLFESLLKRFYGKKDSGWLLPGHGGVMDRFDGVIFATIPLFVYVSWKGGFQ